MNSDSILYSHPLPWIGGYKVYGEGGYTMVLSMKHRGTRAPVEIPAKLTKGELDKLKHHFDEAFEYPRGGLFV